MKFDLQKKDDLHARLTMVIEKEDYAEKLEENFRKYSKKLNIKGFRAGKTPRSVLTKMYGKGMLEETVSTLLNESLFKYLEDEKIGFFGAPVMAEDAEPVDFNPKMPDDYTFVFDLGLKPDISIQYHSETPMEILTLETDDEALQEEILRYRRMFNEPASVDGPVESKDKVTIRIEGVDDSAETAEPVQDIDLDKTPGEAKELLSGKSKGDKLEVDLEKLTGYSRQHILSILGLTDDVEGPLVYTIEILDVKRPSEAEMSGETLSRLMGRPVESEQDLRDMLTQRNARGNQERTLDMKKMAVRLALLKDNPFDMPETFLLHWLNSQRDQQVQHDSKEAKGFLRDARWSFILNKIATAENLEVKEEDIRKQVTQWITQNVNYMQTDIRKLMKELYANEYFMSNMRENALEDIVFQKILPNYSFTERETNQEEFERVFHDMHHELFDHDHSHDHDHTHDHDHEHAHDHSHH